MKNPLFKSPLRISYKDFDKLPEVNDGLNEFMENEVVPAWVNNSPDRDGDYADSIKVTARSANGRGVVGATAKHAHFVEFGASHTPEWAPAEKTAKQFGGYAHDKPTTDS